MWLDRFLPSLEEMNNDRRLRLTWSALLHWAAVSYLLIFVYAASFWIQNPLGGGFPTFLAVFAKGSLLAFGFASVGGLFGFVFGIPRTLQRQDNEARSSEALNTAERSRATRLSTNTNLEQISDWLTKILVGVGLTQLGQIPERLRWLGDHFAGAVEGSPQAALAIILNFSVSGFFTGYLMTRLFLTRAFSEVEQALQEAQAAKEEIIKKVAEVSSKSSENLEAAVKYIGAGAEATGDARRKLLEDLIFSNLYEAPPDGFSKAIKNATMLLNEDPDHPSAPIVAFLAMAYGQQYRWEKEHEARKDVLDQSRRKALECAQKALDVDPGQKGRLRLVWDPKTALYDDDLTVFFDDPEFKKLLG